jgi:hypothetical protein
LNRSFKALVELAHGGKDYASVVTKRYENTDSA